MDEVLLNIYEKDQVKNLTKVAMAGDKTEFNDEAFDREYSQFATLNRYRQQGRPLPQKLPPLAPHDLRASSQLIRRAADETASLLSVTPSIDGKSEARQNKVGKDKYENTEKGDRDGARKEHEQDTKKEVDLSVHVETRG